MVRVTEHEEDTNDGNDGLSVRPPTHQDGKTRSEGKEEGKRDGNQEGSVGRLSAEDKGPNPNTPLPLPPSPGKTPKQSQREMTHPEFLNLYMAELRPMSAGPLGSRS